MRKVAIINAIRDLETICRQNISTMKKERSKLPETDILITANRYFYEYDGEIRKGITRNIKRRQELMRAKFLDKRIRELELCQDHLSKCRTRIEKIQDAYEYMANRFGKSNIDLNEVEWTKKQIASNHKSSENKFKSEELVYSTKAGVKMRSLSEQIWGNIYEELGIPYQYEKKLVVDVTDMPDIEGAYSLGGRLYKNFYPDFTIPLADGSEFYHEHLGLIHKGEYRKKNGEKVIAMFNAGLATKDNFMLTFPKDIQDQSDAMEFIKSKVLPLV